MMANERLRHHYERAGEHRRADGPSQPPVPPPRRRPPGGSGLRAHDRPRSFLRGEQDVRPCRRRPGAHRLRPPCAPAASSDEDLIARYGGEEFCALLRGVDEPEGHADRGAPARQASPACLSTSMAVPCALPPASDWRRWTEIWKPRWAKRTSRSTEPRPWPQPGAERAGNVRERRFLKGWQRRCFLEGSVRFRRPVLPGLAHTLDPTRHLVGGHRPGDQITLGLCRSRSPPGHPIVPASRYPSPVRLHILAGGNGGQHLGDVPALLVMRQTRHQAAIHLQIGEGIILQPSEVSNIRRRNRPSISRRPRCATASAGSGRRPDREPLRFRDLQDERARVHPACVDQGANILRCLQRREHECRDVHGNRKGQPFLLPGHLLVDRPLQHFPCREGRWRRIARRGR